MRERLTVLGIEEMDGIHRQELEMLDALLEAIDNETDETRVTLKFEALLEDMRRHFEYEESLMRGKGFGMYNIHKSDHDKMLSEVRYLLGEWRSRRDRARIKEYFEYEFAFWLPQHIAAMDTVLAEFLRGL